jgi:co-chaperonin GroES (HSP10)
MTTHIENDPGGRSARITHESSTAIPAEAKLRPLRDQIIVEPLPVVLSKTIVTVENTKPLRGIVKAAGPGCYPKMYDHPDKHRRTKMWDSEVFRPTQVKVGDVVELGGYEHRGYAFQTLMWGDTMHVICREEDVSCIVEGMTADQAREEAAHATA